VGEDRRLADQALDRRERRTGTGLAALTFDGGHQSGFLAADKRARAKTKLNIKRETGIENIIAEQAVFMRLIDRNLQALDCDRVFRADINITLRGADRITGDCHGFQHNMRIAFEHGTIHERARIAFIGVAADILLIRLIGSRERPFASGGESRAATSAKTGSGNFIDDLLRGHFGQNLTQSGITVHGNVFVDVFRINHAAVAQRGAALFGVKIGFIQGFDAVFHNRLLIEQTLDDTALEQMLFHDFGNILHRDAAVKAAFRINNHDRAERAKAKAAGAHHVYFFFQPAFCNFFLQGFNDFFAVRGGTTRTAAYKHIGTIHSVSSLFRIGADRKFRYDIAVDQMIVDNANGLLRRHFDICGFSSVDVIDLNNRLKLTDADAAGLGDEHVCEVTLGHFFRQCIQNRARTGCDSAGCHADHHADAGIAFFAKTDLTLHFLFDCLEFC